MDRGDDAGARGVALDVIGGLAFAVASIPGAFREQIWATGLGLLLTGLLVGRQWLALRLILDRVQSRARAWALALSVLPVVLVHARSPLSCSLGRGTERFR